MTNPGNIMSINQTIRKNYVKVPNVDVYVLAWG